MVLLSEQWGRMVSCAPIANRCTGRSPAVTYLSSQSLRADLVGFRRPDRLPIGPQVANLPHEKRVFIQEMNRPPVLVDRPDVDHAALVTPPPNHRILHSQARD